MADDKLSVKVDQTDLVFPQVDGLKLSTEVDKLVEIMPEHKQMLQIVKDSHPEIHRASSLFYKTQSQFMDNMLTVSGLTPIRNMRQILAEMNRTREAIKEATINLKKKEIELRQKQKELSKESLELRLKKAEYGFSNTTGEKMALLAIEIEDLQDKELERQELLKTEIVNLMTSIDTTRGYLSGAIRKLTNATVQYNSIMEKHNLQSFTEAQFEEEEERYHIIKAFDQALSAARSNPSRLVDEGNMIYFSQIGINGAHAQARIRQFFAAEDAFFKDSKAPTHQFQIDFLMSMAEEFKDSAKKLAEYKGMQTVTSEALINKGDQSLLKIESK